jgi:hypothetical protein
MKYETYEGAVANDLSSFDFTSIGRKGRVKKRILFMSTNKSDLFNLAMGDVTDDGDKFDDKVVTDNGDRDKILATIAKAVSLYTERYPERSIYFRGNTEARTRLYRMAIATHIGELSERFVIYGELADWDLQPFAVGMPYRAFLIQRKIV